MRIVADSNILISALVFGGKPGQLLRTAEANQLVLIVSPPILLEVAEILDRKFLWSESLIAAALLRIQTASELASAATQVAACIDPDDDRILEAALAANANYIVSGDKHLLGMKHFRGVNIVTVREFLELFAAIPEPDPHA